MSGNIQAMADEFVNLTGNYSSVGMDTGSDGQIDYLQLAVGLQVIQAAPYSLVAWLEDGAGTQIAWASAVQSWPAGTHTAELRFDGPVIRRKGLNGPYIIKRVEVRSGAEDGIVVAAADNVHTTGAYLVNQFELPLVAFTGNFSDSGQVPHTGAGYFNRLRLNIGLNVVEQRRPGNWLVDEPKGAGRRGTNADALL
jgi:hypothetical protein